MFNGLLIKLALFLGFLEARSTSAPPEWWVQSVLRSRANRRDNIYGGEPTKSPYHSTEVEYVAAPVGTTLQKRGDQYFIKVGNDSIVIPSEFVSNELYGGISAAFTENECFIASHTNWGYPHKVVCVDRKSGKLQWESEACGCWWGVVASGFQISWVSVVVNDDCVTVFGKAGGFYAHSFSRETGKTLFRFSSGF